MKFKLKICARAHMPLGFSICSHKSKCWLINHWHYILVQI